MEAAAKAAVMTAPGQDLEFRTYPLEPVGPGELLVRVTCCTICGSDIHSWTGRRPAPTPIILGHEIVGRIEAMGEGVSRDAGDRLLSTGDRITWTIADSCGGCFNCRQAGLPMKCRDLKKYGHDRCDAPPHFRGGFAEYCYIGAGTGVVKLPESIADETAAPANCALATAAAGWEAAGLRPFQNVLILGAGALGFYASAFARHAGCRRIIVADIAPQRLAAVRRFGADHTLNLRGLATDQTVRAVRDMTDGRGADCVLEAAGAPALVPLGLKCLRTGGCFIEIGNSVPEAYFSYDACDIVWRRLTIKGVHNYDVRHLQAGVDLLETAKDRFPFHEIATHRVGLTDINEGLRLARSPSSLRVAVLP